MSDWTPPSGFTLTATDEHWLDSLGRAWSTPPADRMRDGQINVFWFGRALVAGDVAAGDDPRAALTEIDVAPWALTPNDGRGPFATEETRQAALDGKPIMGWNPVVLEKPIKDGYVPPQLVLVKDDDPTLGAVEPASATPRDLTPAEEADRLRESIAAAQARLDEIGGSS